MNHNAIVIKSIGGVSGKMIESGSLVRIKELIQSTAFNHSYNSPVLYRVEYWSKTLSKYCETYLKPDEFIWNNQTVYFATFTASQYK